MNPTDDLEILPDPDGGLRRSTDVAHAWARAHPTTLDAVLEWNAQVRAIFGDPVPDRGPWRWDDVRL